MNRSYPYAVAEIITQRDTEDRAYRYSYDRINRLTQAKPPQALQSVLPQEAYTYDAVHNRLSSQHQPGAWTYDADNQLLSWGSGAQSTALTYTPNGHTETETQGSSTKTYVYNAADRLSEVKQNSQTMASYQYDPLGRRISKTVNGQITYFVYGEEGLLAEVNAQGQMTVAYGWQPNGLWGTDPLWQATLTPNQTLANAQYSFTVTDHLGTPQIAADSSGNKVWKGLSEAFGRTVTEPGSATTQNLRFPGQYFDAETGLHQNYFRDYSPSLGRYVESDPIGLRGGANLWGYVMGDPISSVDSTGLVEHNTGRTKKCGNCTIRIDYTLDPKTNVVVRHLHWECKGKEGAFGEGGRESHGGICEDAPKNIQKCAEENGFKCKPDPVPVILPEPKPKKVECNSTCQTATATGIAALLLLCLDAVTP